MSRYDLMALWESIYHNKTEAFDYAGRRMVKSSIGNPNSAFSPTIEHIRPLAHGGKDCLENIIICNRKTNQEKADRFPTWSANGSRFQAKRVSGSSNEYDIYQLD